ncbi:MAG TPA: glucose 1-dehydrogenase [Syntrophorhabdaceae bacterium]|nr:glucose 1-dehydrogenase [Syntrophorhabdaceae bacterium]
MKLLNKVAIVTGGGQGIGEGIALKLAKEGADVAIADLNVETAGGVAKKITELGRKAIAVQTDVTSSASVNAMAQEVINKLGTIDILVNNAGYVAPMMRNFTKETEEYWNQVIAVCLNGVILCSRAVVDTMIAKEGGKIISIASDAARVGQQGQAVYSGAKGGVVAFSKAIARELARYKINVNCIAPGATNTPAFQQAPAEMREAAAKIYPLRRVAEVEDIANAVAFLASDEAAFITGQIISVSGGYTMC